MSSSKSSSGGKGFIHYFRSTVKFTERLFHNLIVQTKWIWENSKKAHSSIVSWHGRNFSVHPSWKYIYGVLVALIAISITLPILFFWSIVKSV